VREIEWEGTYRIPHETDLVVHARSIGLYPDTLARVPIESSALHSGMIVCEPMPNPPRSRQIQDAVTRGCSVLDGLDMLVNQGAMAVKLWTGRSCRPEIMRETLTALFSTKTNDAVDSIAHDAVGSPMCSWRGVKRTDAYTCCSVVYVSDLEFPFLQTKRGEERQRCHLLFSIECLQEKVQSTQTAVEKSVPTTNLFDP